MPPACAFQHPCSLPVPQMSLGLSHPRASSNPFLPLELVPSLSLLVICSPSARAATPQREPCLTSSPLPLPSPDQVPKNGSGSQSIHVHSTVSLLVTLRAAVTSLWLCPDLKRLTLSQHQAVEDGVRFVPILAETRINARKQDVFAVTGIHDGVLSVVIRLVSPSLWTPQGQDSQGFSAHPNLSTRETHGTCF